MKGRSYHKKIKLIEGDTKTSVGIRYTQRTAF